MGEIDTINETDFIWFDGAPQGITHAILYDAVGADHIPAVIGASIVENKDPVGYMTSKHIHSSPHTFLDVGFTGWPIYRKGNTLIVEVLTPAHISRDISQQKNAWLFNYPPARDVAAMLVDLGVQTFCVLTSSAFDDMMGNEQEGIVEVKAEKIGLDDSHSSLQPLWGWLPAFLFSVEAEGASILILPPHGAKSTPREYAKTALRDALGILTRRGPDTTGALPRSKKLYSQASEEATQAAKHANEVIARMKAETKKNNMGGMFQ